MCACVQDTTDSVTAHQTQAQATTNRARKLSHDPLWREICILEIKLHTAIESRERLCQAALAEVAVAKDASSMEAMKASLGRLEELLMEGSESS